MMKPGEYAYAKMNNEHAQILAVSEIWGFVSYKVFRPTDGEVYKLSADSLITVPAMLLERAISNKNIRYILADEVEVGLIIKALKARGLIKRILVVCPTGGREGISAQGEATMSEFMGNSTPEVYNEVQQGALQAAAVEDNNC